MLTCSQQMSSSFVYSLSRCIESMFALIIEYFAAMLCVNIVFVHVTVKRSFVQPGVSSAVMGGECEEHTIKLSLKCPITYRTITLPARGHDCKHIQVGDNFSAKNICRNFSWVKQIELDLVLNRMWNMHHRSIDISVLFLRRRVGNETRTDDDADRWNNQQQSALSFINAPISFWMSSLLTRESVILLNKWRNYLSLKLGQLHTVTIGTRSRPYYSIVYLKFCREPLRIFWLFKNALFIVSTRKSL